MKGTITAASFFVTTMSCLLCSGAATAQEDSIEEIVVTASKRGESTLLETPMSIQAITGEELETRGIDQFIDFARTISGLSFEDQGPGDKEVVLRGLQSTGAATTGMYFDDIVITSNHRQDGGGRQPDIKLVDMQRIEVLKGPQGTLYGASSMGGTVRMITNKPDPTEAGGAFNVDLGSTHSADGLNYQVDATLNVPIIEDELAVRVVGYDSELAGYIDDRLVGDAGFFDGDGVNNAVVSGGRVAFRWNLTDRLTLDLMGIRQDTKSNGPAWYQPAYGEFVQRNYVAAPWDETLDAHNVALEWQADHGVFTATASRMQRDIFYRFPATRILCSIFAGNQGLDTGPCLSPGPDPRVAVPAGPNPTGYATLSAVDQPQDREISSSEVRYASLWDGPIQVIGGLYYQTEENNFRSQVIDVLNMEGDRSPFVGGLNVDRLTNTKIDQVAAFGELSYEFTEALTATVGARAFNFDIDELGQNFADRGRPVDGEPVLTSSSEDDVNFKFNLAYGAPDEDLTVYATFSQGFRSGGNNEPDFATGTVFPPFQSDTLNNYEIGAKGKFFDGALRLDMAAYYMDWSDLQARGLFSGVDGGTFLILDNIGDAEIKGVEIGALATPFAVPEFRIGGTLSLLEAKLATDTAVQTGPNTGREGDRIPNVPEVTGNLFGEYVFPLAQWEVIARIDYSYVGESFNDFRPDSPRYRSQGDYSLVDLRATFNLGERYRIAVYAANVFDEKAAVTQFADANLRRPDQIIPLRPRTIGIRLGYEF